MELSESTQALLGLGIGTIGLLAIVFYVLLVIAYWKLFNKMGEPGWKSIIPFYNTYTQYKKTWNGTMGLVAILLPIVGGVAANLLQNSVSNNMLSVFLIALSLILAFISVVSYFKLAHSFGKGTGFIIGLVFFPSIFLLILGFGSAEYIGPDGDRNAIE